MPAFELEIPPALRGVLAQLHWAARREAWVGDAVAIALGQDALNVLATARRRHPAAIPESLVEACASGEPHGVLERCVLALLIREAAGHQALLLLHGDDAEVRLRLAAFDHGVEIGRECSGPAPLGVSGVFDALSATVLEDMPCRPRVTLVSEQPSRVRWVHEQCPYREAWNQAGVRAAPACQIMSAWIRGLATGLDSGVEYRRPRALALGDARCEHELTIHSG